MILEAFQRKPVHRVKYPHRTGARNIDWEKVDKMEEIKKIWRDELNKINKHIEHLNSLNKPQHLI